MASRAFVLAVLRRIVAVEVVGSWRKLRLDRQREVQARIGHQLVSLGNDGAGNSTHVVIVGGEERSGELVSLEQFCAVVELDTSQDDTWRETFASHTGDVPRTRFAHCCASLSASSFVMFGGWHDQDAVYLDDAFVANVDLNTHDIEWFRIDVSSNESAPEGCHSHAMCKTSNNRFFVHGGRGTDHRQLTDLWQLTLEFDASRNVFVGHWTLIDDGNNEQLSPSSRLNHVMCSVGDGLVVHGGYGIEEEKTWKYSFDSQQWSQVIDDTKSGNSADRWSSSSCNISTNVFALCCGYKGSKKTNDMLLFDNRLLMSAQSPWIAVQQQGDIPSERSSSAITRIDRNRLVLFGGRVRSYDELNGMYECRISGLEFEDDDMTLKVLCLRRVRHLFMQQANFGF